MRKLLVALALAATGLVAVPAHATTPSPAGPSDVPLNGTEHAAVRAAGTVDAANAYVDRTFPAGTAYYNETHVVPEVAPDSTGYFFSHQVDFVNDGPGGAYIGLQTELFTNGVNQGNGFIFSVFGGTGVYPGNLPGTTAVHGFESGQEFYSIHVAWDWQLGHSYSLQLQQPGGCAGGALCAYVIGQIIDETDHRGGTLGSITFPPSWQGINPAATFNWIEEYLPSSYAACTDINPARGVWTGAERLFRKSAPAVSVFSTPPANPHIQTGTGCTNSAVVDLGGTPAHSYRLIVGATS